MKGFAILLLLVVCLVCIEDGNAWGRRRRRWIRWRRVFRVARNVATGAAVVGVIGKKRDVEAVQAVPLLHKSCMMSHYDKDNDGKITKYELKSMLKDVQKDNDVFEKFDVNGDGHVDEMEFSVKVGHLVAACQKSKG